VIELLVYVTLFLAVLASIVIIRILFFEHSDKEKELLKQRIKELEEQIELQRKHYELLLKDAAVKNTVMVSLYNAWRNGELRKCYSKGGEIRVLFDGTIICEMPDKEKSYAIRGEENGASK